MNWANKAPREGEGEEIVYRNALLSYSFHLLGYIDSREFMILSMIPNSGKLLKKTVFSYFTLFATCAVIVSL